MALPMTFESYIQVTGRAGHAGCDNLSSLALLVKKASRRAFVEKSMTAYSNKELNCRRDVPFEDFDDYSRNYYGVLCLCCDVCQNSCKCMNCSKPAFIHLFYITDLNKL